MIDGEDMLERAKEKMVGSRKKPGRKKQILGLSKQEREDRALSEAYISGEDSSKAAHEARLREYDRMFGEPLSRPALKNRLDIMKLRITGKMPEDEGI